MVQRGMKPQRSAHLFGCGVRSLYRWKANFRQFGDVVPPSSLRRGRPRLLSTEQWEALIAHARTEVDLTLRELQDWSFARFARRPSASAVCRYLDAAGLSRQKISHVATSKDEEQCTYFREHMQPQLPARMCVWIDESSKDDRTFLRHYGRAPRGQRAIRRDKLPKGQRYSILPAMAVDAGYIAMRVVRGSVKSMDFISFVLDDVVCPLRLCRCMLANLLAVATYKRVPGRSQRVGHGQLPNPQEPAFAQSCRGCRHVVFCGPMIHAHPLQVDDWCSSPRTHRNSTR